MNNWTKVESFCCSVLFIYLFLQSKFSQILLHVDYLKLDMFPIDNKTHLRAIGVLSRMYCRMAEKLEKELKKIQLISWVNVKINIRDLIP